MADTCPMCETKHRLIVLGRARFVVKVLCTTCWGETTVVTRPKVAA